MKTWQLQEAKAKFSQLCREVADEGPAKVTRHGGTRKKNVFIVCTQDHYEAITICPLKRQHRACCRPKTD
jgi:prevent-host-death family protein